MFNLLVAAKPNHRILATLVLILFINPVYAINPKTYIPPSAFEHRDTIKLELDRLWPEMVEYNYVPSLIEHESCLSLTHSRCWSSTSRLKSSREEGAGLGQVTRTWTEDGKLRFDTLNDMKRIYITELKDLTWSNVYSRPDLQIRMIILHLLNDYKNLYEFNDPMVRLQATDAAYNGGRGAVNYNRRACGLTSGCDPQIWFGHVELHSNKSTKVLYGNRSARQIFLDHPRDVFFNRLPKYKAQYFVFDEEPEEEVIEEVEEIIEEEEVLVENDVVPEYPELEEVKEEKGFLAFLKKLFGRG